MAAGKDFSRALRFAACLAPWLAGVLSVRADVSLPSLFSDHAVLQKSGHTPVWGWGEPGENVTVTLDAASASSQAGPDGRWQTFLDLQKEGPGPFTLTVAGKNQIQIADVVVGEVWLCSGQSNMELPLSATAGAPAEVAASANPQLRMFTVKKQFSLTPLDRCDGRWVLAGPATSAAFSAVGYYFGKALQQNLQVPVGVIHSSWGGSAIESWMSSGAMDGDPDLKATKDKILAAMKDYAGQMKDYVDRYHAWETTYARQDHPADPAAFAAPEVSTADWIPVKLPSALAQAGLPDAGAIWVRCTVQVSPQAAKVYHPFHFAFGDFDAFYWNGVKVGETTADKSTGFNTLTTFSPIRRYDLLPVNIKPGANTLALRIFAPAGGAGTAPAGYKFGEPGLSFGPWLAKAEFAFPPLSAEAQAAYPPHPLLPPAAQVRATFLDNGMIQPLMPYGMRGVVWYQGESNADRAAQYRTALRLLIQDWRAQWGEGDFPFYICQLPDYGAKKPTPAESSWAELRESQAQMLALPQTGLAVLIGLGETNNIHPRDKKDVGDRVAHLALAKTYGQQVPWTGPVYRGMTIEGGDVRLTFDHAENGLVAQPLPATYLAQSNPPTPLPLVPNSPGSELEGFAICGADHRWQWAQAKIDHDSVVVWSPAVPAPVAVRYAWADSPTCNLAGANGLPAAPFRTDDFPLSTAGKKY